MKRSDEELIAAYVEGDERALSTLLSRYLGDVSRFAYSLTHDSALAEDVAQEAFVKAWKHMRGFAPGGNFRAWLFTIARNTALDALRKRRDIALSTFDTETGGNMVLDTVADSAPLPDELLARAEDARYVAGLLGALSPAYREVLMLRAESNMTFEEIGRMLGRPLHTVKSQYRRAVAALQRVARA